MTLFTLFIAIIGVTSIVIILIFIIFTVIYILLRKCNRQRKVNFKQTSGGHPYSQQQPEAFQIGQLHGASDKEEKNETPADLLPLSLSKDEADNQLATLETSESDSARLQPNPRPKETLEGHPRKTLYHSDNKLNDKLNEMVEEAVEKSLEKRASSFDMKRKVENHEKRLDDLGKVVQICFPLTFYFLYYFFLCRRQCVPHCSVRAD